MFLVTVDLNKCRACGECVKLCPNEAFEISEVDGKLCAFFTGSPAECTGCYSCEAGCEDTAIIVTEL
jgi:NAD-dependent dihydropyrimidine dehydrogenase PreA subunit